MLPAPKEILPPPDHPQGRRLSSSELERLESNLGQTLQGLGKLDLREYQYKSYTVWVGGSAAAPQVVRMLRQAGWAAWQTTAPPPHLHRVVKVDMEASYYWPEWSLWQRLLWKLFG
jgi:hypothetical protein